MPGTGTGCSLYVVSMPSRAWVVTINTLICMVQRGSFNALTGLSCYEGAGNGIFRRCCVSMPSRAWVVTKRTQADNAVTECFNALTGLSCYVLLPWFYFSLRCFNALTGLSCYLYILTREVTEEEFQCPHGLELLLVCFVMAYQSHLSFNALTGLSCYVPASTPKSCIKCFNALTGLSCYQYFSDASFYVNVSMPSRAWVVTQRLKSLLKRMWMFQCPHGLELLQQECPIF